MATACKTVVSWEFRESGSISTTALMPLLMMKGATASTAFPDALTS